MPQPPIWMAGLFLALVGLAVIGTAAAWAPQTLSRPLQQLFNVYILALLAAAVCRLARLLWANRLLIQLRLRGWHQRAWQNYVQSLFDGYARTYDRHLIEDLNYRGPEHLELFMKDQLTGAKPGTIGELGCGTGLCGPALRPIANRLVGVDLSGDMLEHARKRAVYDQLERTNVLSFLFERPATFDGLVAIDVFPYFDKLDHLLSVSASALRPDGWLIATIELPENTPATHSPLRSEHDEDQTLDIAGRHGLALCRKERVALRDEAGEPVMVAMFMLRKLPPSNQNVLR